VLNRVSIQNQDGVHGEAARIAQVDREVALEIDGPVQKAISDFILLLIQVARLGCGGRLLLLLPGYSRSRGRGWLDGVSAPAGCARVKSATMHAPSVSSPRTDLRAM